MSHLAEREEKDCLNCGTTVAGRYCQHCGQENLPPKESLWHLIVHFFNDFTHFDGKFFSTVRLLLFKPGFLSQEYMLGRRARYLNPIRMYLFVSFAFFLFLFSLPDTTTSGGRNEMAAATAADTTATGRTVLGRTGGGIVITTNDGAENIFDSTVAAYNRRQLSLPEAKRDHFVRRYFWRRMIAVRAYARTHRETFGRDLTTKVQQITPKMFFISIPLFAGILQLLYIRRRQTWYYATHGIFAVHFYCATFLILFGVYLCLYLGSVGTYAAAILILSVFVYLYLAMKRFYQQGRAKTIVKYFLLVASASIVLTMLVLSAWATALFSLAAH